MTMEVFIFDGRQVHPLTDFLRNHKAHMARLKETMVPEVLTVNGRAEVVIQDAESYQDLLDRLHYMETLTAIRVWPTRLALPPLLKRPGLACLPEQGRIVQRMMWSCAKSQDMPHVCYTARQVFTTAGRESAW
jgi:hypothetical protein